MKTSAFNIPDLGKENGDISSNFDMGREQNMEQELKLKKEKKKINFDKLFPAPKNNKNMGMDWKGKSIFEEEFF